jgi:hypothetical protein
LVLGNALISLSEERERAASDGEIVHLQATATAYVNDECPDPSERLEIQIDAAFNFDLGDGASEYERTKLQLAHSLPCRRHPVRRRREAEWDDILKNRHDVHCLAPLLALPCPFACGLESLNRLFPIRS